MKTYPEIAGSTAPETEDALSGTLLCSSDGRVHVLPGSAPASTRARTARQNNMSRTLCELLALCHVPCFLRRCFRPLMFGPTVRFMCCSLSNLPCAPSFSSWVCVGPGLQALCV